MYNNEENMNNELESLEENSVQESEIEVVSEEINEDEAIVTEDRSYDDKDLGFTDEFVYTETKVKPKRKGFLKPLLITALCACVAGVVFSFAVAVTEEIAEEISEKIGTTQQALNKDREEEAALLSFSEFASTDGVMSIESIVDACLPSVVAITNKGVSEVMTFFGNYQMESESSGSGIIIGKNDTELLIVTNYHVVADSKELTVVFSHDEELAQEDDTYMNPALIKGYDAQKDIAVIAVRLNEISEETMGKIKIATLGNSDDIKLGSGVVAIGNSLGYGQSVTHGIVSAVNREVDMPSLSGGGTTSNEYIQTDAAINAGNSGGALLNMKGELIGINSAKISSTGVEGMGYAIPISSVEELIGELMSLKTRDVVDEDKRGYLGILGVDVTNDVSMAYGLPIGIFIQETVENSPAAKAGILSGDVIVGVDKVTVNSMSDLQARLAYYEAGEQVTITVKRQEGRNFVEADINVVLGNKEEAGIED